MYTLETVTDFFDDFRDVSSEEKRIVRVGTRTFEKTGTYITLICIIKLTKRCSKCIKQLL